MTNPTNRKQLYRAIIVSSMSTFTTVYSMTFLTTYLPQMTLWMGYREEDKGYYVGVVMLSYYLAGALTSCPLSWLSDKFGHHRVIIALLATNAVCTFVFAFTTNFVMASVVYFLIGTCNSAISSSRAILAIFSDDTTQTVTMATLVLARGSGLTISTVIGGYLSSPVEKYPKIFGHSEFFIKFPYSIPPLVGTLFCITTAIVVSRVYPKNLGIYRQSSSTDALFDEDSRRSVGTRYGTINDADQLTSFTESRLTTTQPLPSEESVSDGKPDDTTFNHRHYVNVTRPCDFNIYTEEDDSMLDRTRKNYFKKLLSQNPLKSLLQDTNVLKLVVTVSLSFAVDMTFIEILSTWASTVKEYGGLAYSTDGIGQVLIIVVLPCAFLQLVTSSCMERLMGSINACVLICIVQMTGVSLIPLCRFIDNKEVQYAALVIIEAVISFCELSATTYLGTIINNAAPLNNVGLMNGIIASMRNISKSLFSLIAGSIYAKSIVSPLGSPVDVSLCFVFMGFNLWVAAVFAYFLPSHLNKKGRNNSCES